VLEGDLTDFSLPDILRLLAFTSKSGRLQLHQGEAAGRVELAGGRVRDVSADARRLPLARRLVGAGALEPAAVREALAGDDELPTDAELAARLVARGVLDEEQAAEAVKEQAIDAAFGLLQWRQGSFRFDGADEGADGTAGPLDVSVDDLLGEVEARGEAWRELTERTGDGDAVVTIGRPAGGKVEIDRHGWALLALVDGRRRLDDLAELSGRGAFATRQTLAALLDQGVVTVGAGEGQAPAERLLAAQRELGALEAALGGAPEPPVATSADAPAGASTGEPTPSSAADPRRPEAAEVTTTSDATDEAVEAPTVPPPGAEPSALRTKVRADRIAADPNVDPELVDRLIDGVERL
jgi:hypothetical protein